MGQKRELRFSVSGNPEIEQSYRTHYISPVLSEIKQKKLQEKLDKPPELVVFRTVQDSQCSQCKKELHKGSFLFMEAGQPLCLCCANLSELEYLPRGNAKLTRRVKKEASSLQWLWNLVVHVNVMNVRVSWLKRSLLEKHDRN